jgi:hypothetical protein
MFFHAGVRDSDDSNRSSESAAYADYTDWHTPATPGFAGRSLDHGTGVERAVQKPIRSFNPRVVVKATAEGRRGPGGHANRNAFESA